jgi:UDPglucose 6-dehydrogenase
VEYVAKAEDVAEGADALVIATEWVDFKTIDWKAVKAKMLSPLIFDGRNLLDPAEMRALGFTYYSIGRS